ncbi:MAG: hypothetical protein WAR83_15320 [Flavobacteriales bacterium]
MPSDSERLGLISGLLVPVLGFVIYAFLYVTGIRPHLTFSYFVNDLFLGTRTYQSPILSLSLIANLPLFFWFDRNEMQKAMRGVILASFVYAVIIVALWLIA